MRLHVLGRFVFIAVGLRGLFWGSAVCGFADVLAALPGCFLPKHPRTRICRRWRAAFPATDARCDRGLRRCGLRPRRRRPSFAGASCAAWRSWRRGYGDLSFVARRGVVRARMAAERTLACRQRSVCSASFSIEWTAAIRSRAIIVYIHAIGKRGWLWTTFSTM